MLGLQALGQLADGCVLAARVAFDLQQQLVLQGRYAVAASELLAVAQETPQFVAKVGHRAVVP